MLSYDQSRRNLENILTECQRENTTLRDEQTRLNNQLLNLYAGNQRLAHENQILLDENRELQDLCLYLDDERIRLSKMVEEWEKFSRFYCDKFSSDMSMCQEKMKKLEALENSLLKNKETNERLTSPIGSLRRGGDGSSSPSPSMEVQPKDQNLASHLHQPCSDSEDSLSKKVSDPKSPSFYYRKPNRSDLANAGGKPWNRSFQDVTRDMPRNTMSNHNKTMMAEYPTSLVQTHPIESSSLNRSLAGNRGHTPPSTRVMFMHPFQKVHSNPSLTRFDDPIKPIVKTSSRNEIPKSKPHLQTSHSQNLNARPSSAVPPNFHPNMIGYHLVDDSTKHERIANKILMEKESSRRFTNYTKDSFNLKTSF